MNLDSHSVLLVTKDTKVSTLISAMLIPPMFELNVVTDFNDARRRCAERVYNIIIVDSAEGEGTDFATDISDSTSTILLLTPNQFYEQISYKVESFGIISVPSTSGSRDAIPDFADAYTNGQSS